MSEEVDESWGTINIRLLTEMVPASDELAMANEKFEVINGK
jgi:hypothetical protein